MILTFCGVLTPVAGALLQVGESAFAELKVASNGALGAQSQTVLWPALGGLATGCIALLYPEVLYQVLRSSSVVWCDDTTSPS